MHKLLAKIATLTTCLLLFSAVPALALGGGIDPTGSSTTGSSSTSSTNPTTSSSSTSSTGSNSACDNAQTTKDELLCGANNASNNNQTPAQATSSLNQTIANVINVLSVIVGIIAIIMIIVGAFRLITSAGKEQSITAAKQTLQYAIVGLVIVAIAQVVVRFVLHKVATTTNNSTSSSQTGGLGAGAAH